MKIKIKSIDLLNTGWLINQVGVYFEIENTDHFFNTTSTCDAEPPLEYTCTVPEGEVLMDQLVQSQTPFAVSF